MTTHVKNMTSTRSDREVPNQFVIKTPEGLYFQSYQTVIAFQPFDESQPTLIDRDNWDYSATTLKYLKEFLGTGMTRQQIADELETPRLHNWKTTTQLN